MLDTALAPSTKASYQNAWQHFRKFHSTYYPGSPVLPVTTEQIAQFITVCHHRNLQPSTITSYLSAISYVHKIRGLVNPTDSFLISKLLHGLRRNKQADKRLPLTIKHLQLITAYLKSSTNKYTYRLLKAMFLTAFFGLLRAGEIARSVKSPINVIQRRDIEFAIEDSKVTSITLKMRNFKHSNGRIARIPLGRQSTSNICPVRALLRYLKITPVSMSQLFCLEDGKPVTTSFLGCALKSCILACNLNSEQYTTHSLRIGGATHAYQSGMSPVQIKRLGRWQSDAYLKYIRIPTLSL